VPGRENLSRTVKRSLLFAGAIALAAALPVATLGAPSGRPAASRPPAAHPQANVREGSAAQGGFNVPLHINVQARSLTAGPYARQTIPAGVVYPTLYGPACAANSLWSAPGEQQPTEYTLGSLVDGKSNLLSSPSFGGSFPGLNATGAAPSSPLTFQAVAYPTACGPQSFTTF